MTKNRLKLLLVFFGICSTLPCSGMHHLLLNVVPIHSKYSLIFIFSIAYLNGLVALFTPYLYPLVPITIQNLSPDQPDRGKRQRNKISFSLYLTVIFLAAGLLVSSLSSLFNFPKLTTNWIFNFILARLFLGLGLSLIGAFEFKLPKIWRSKARDVADNYSQKGIFYMALTLPVLSFSSIAPILCLVLLLANSNGLLGTLIGMGGLAGGIVTAFIFPGFINLMPSTVLNQVKVLLGFLALLIGFKFFSLADNYAGWGLINRELFIIIILVLSSVLGLYFLGKIKLNNDYQSNLNIYGQEYVPLLKLFIALGLFTFSIFLLPGIWGAPLQGLSFFLPN